MRGQNLESYNSLREYLLIGPTVFCLLHDVKKEPFFKPFNESLYISGTRFRPLSLDVPKPLFPVAGLPMIQHHIEACVKVPDLKEILLIGYYPACDLAQFVLEMVQEYKIIIR